MPMHGEYRMLQAHARIAEEAGVRPHAVRIADNGTVLELDGDGLSVEGQIDAGIVLVDGLNMGDLRDVVLRDRRHLASDGVLIVVATIAADTGRPIAEPEMIVRGLDAPDEERRAAGRAGARPSSGCSRSARSTGPPRCT